MPQPQALIKLFQPLLLLCCKIGSLVYLDFQLILIFHLLPVDLEYPENTACYSLLQKILDSKNNPGFPVSQHTQSVPVYMWLQVR